eukprot:384324-Alexandrium_andersonii.AAC.1
MNTVPRMLADDLHVYCQGQDAFRRFTDALSTTHTYLQDMGAVLALDKSACLASSPVLRRRIKKH